MINEKIEQEKIGYKNMRLLAYFSLGIFVQNVIADEMVHEFKSPSFLVLVHSHYLTIENQQFNRKMTIKQE